MIRDRFSAPSVCSKDYGVSTENQELAPSFVWQLNEGLRIAQLERTSQDTLTQLNQDPVQLANNGVIAYARREGEHEEQESFAMPKILVSLLEGLKEQPNQKDMYSWVYQNIRNGNKDFTLDIINGLVRFVSHSLDTSLLRQIYQTDHGTITLTALKALSMITTTDWWYFDHIRDVGSQARLSESATTLHQRFPNLLTWRLDEISEESFDSNAQPSLDFTVDNAVNYAKTNSSGSDKRTIANSILKYYESSGLINIRGAILRFKDRFGQSQEEQELSTMVQNLAIDSRLLEDPEGGAIKQQLKINRLKALESLPRTDLVEANFKVLKDRREAQTSQQVHTFRIFFIGGTIAHHTLGHTDFIDRVSQFMKSEDTQDDGVLRIVALAPYSNLAGLSDYTKDVDTAGLTQQRFGASMSELAYHQDDNIWFTIKSQPPDPSQVINTVGRLEYMKGEIKQAIEKSLGNSDVNVEMVVCSGTDKLWWISGDSKIADCRQPRKLQERSLIVGRYGDKGNMLDCIKSAEILTNTTNSDYILIPGTRYTSSSQSIQNIAQGFPPFCSVGTEEFAIENWNPESIAMRRNSKIRPLDSVYDIWKYTIETQRRLLRKNETLTE